MYLYGNMNHVPLRTDHYVVHSHGFLYSSFKHFNVDPFIKLTSDIYITVTIKNISDVENTCKLLYNGNLLLLFLSMKNEGKKRCTENYAETL